MTNLRVVLKMAISASLLSLKYWLHINDEENNKSQDKFVFQSVSGEYEEQSSFGDQIKKILEFDWI